MQHIRCNTANATHLMQHSKCNTANATHQMQMQHSKCNTANATQQMQHWLSWLIGLIDWLIWLIALTGCIDWLNSLNCLMGFVDWLNWLIELIDCIDWSNWSLHDSRNQTLMYYSITRHRGIRQLPRRLTAGGRNLCSRRWTMTPTLASWPSISRRNTLMSTIGVRLSPRCSKTVLGSNRRFR